MKATALGILLLAALPLAAAEFEQLLLPIAPSRVHCGLESRYETRLLAFNDSADDVDNVCADGQCGKVRARSTREFIGDFAGGLPLPAYVYLPKSAKDRVRMSLVVESHERTRPEERSYTELPVVRVSEFTTGKMQFIGVRMDPDFRQTVRIYGLDGHSYGQVMMHVYDINSGELLHSCPHHLWPLTADLTDEGLQARPSFGMECNMSHHIEALGQKVRVELEPVTEGLKYWAFMSITNNRTQHFYTVLPR